MLASLGLGKKDANALLLSRVAGLARDPRGWQEVAKAFIQLPPDANLSSLKDKRLLETLLSLCEAQLLPYPALNAATFDLLHATKRLVATRPLHAHVAKFSLGFFATAAASLLRATTSADDGAASVSPHDAWRLLVAIVGVLETVADLPGASASSSEDARLETSGRTQLEASGVLPTIFNVLAAASRAARAMGPDPLLQAATTSALHIMHALLVQRHDHTEYRVRLVAVNLAVEHREALLQLCRHPDDMARTQACARDRKSHMRGMCMHACMHAGDQK